MASHLHFPSPSNWSLMSACLQHFWWWFLWSLVWVFTSAPPLSSSSLMLCPPLQSNGPLSQFSPATHIYGYLTWFFFEPPHWVPNLCHTSCLYHTFALTHGLPIDSLFPILSCVAWVHIQNQDQDTRSPHSPLADLFWILLLTAQ